MRECQPVATELNTKNQSDKTELTYKRGQQRLPYGGAKLIVPLDKTGKASGAMKPSRKTYPVSSPRDWGGGR